MKPCFTVLSRFGRCSNIIYFRFVSTEILEGIIKAKNIFDNLPDCDLREARKRANPFETIAMVIFQNRYVGLAAQY